MSVNVEMLELADKVVGMLINNEEREGCMITCIWITGSTYRCSPYSMFKVYKRTGDKSILTTWLTGMIYNFQSLPHTKCKYRLSCPYHVMSL